jgi:AcrR family transcriptional regulator
MTTTRKDRKTERYYRKREHVVDIAVELFSKNGYAGTGVADIGEAAGLARGALYYYIDSKQALLAKIHDRVMDPLLTEAAAIVDLDVSFQARLRLLSESLLWQIIHRQDHVWVFLHEYRQLEGEYLTLFRDKRHRFESNIMFVLADGQRQGALRVRDLELTTLSFLNLHNYTYQWVGTRNRMSVEELSRFYCEIFFNGVLVDNGDLDAVDAEMERGRAVLNELREAAANEVPIPDADDTEDE